MKILRGKWGTTFEAAAKLAFEDAGLADMSSEVTDLFASAVGTNEPRDQAHKSLKSAIRERYGRSATWEGKLRLIPVPELRFYRLPIPQLQINVQGYAVWPGEVETSDDSYSITLVGPIGKPETLVLPMVFLQAMLDDDMRFSILAKSGSYTTWEIPGAKPVRLPNDFVDELSEIFERKSVAMWLDGFGSQGRSVAPLVVGSLLGLQFMGAARPIPAGEQAWSEEMLISALVRMAYTMAEAKEMIRRAAPNLRVDHTLEEAIRLVLQQGAKGE